MSNRVVYVEAKFVPVGEYKTTQVPTGERKKGLLGPGPEIMREEKKWVQTGFSDSEIDGVLLSQEVQQAITKLNNEGYEVIGMSDVVSGKYRAGWGGMNQGGYGWGYGYSYTAGVMILARNV